jgi:hypothetical protein
LKTFWSTIRAIASAAFAISLCACGGPIARSVDFSQSVQQLEAYDFLELTATISWPYPDNPFTDARIHGIFELDGRRQRWEVDGFCDSEDGKIYRVRFMPPAPGSYTYSIEYREGRYRTTAKGTFTVVDGHRRGPVRIDPQNRWHFIWEGTGEHYFFNGTTAYWLTGWRDDSVIQYIIDRFSRLKINRVRVTVAGRTNLFYGEPIMLGPTWTSMITPWPAKLRYDIDHPGFDYTRFYLPHWQKLDRALRFARDKDIVFSLILDMNDSTVHPAEGSDDESRFLHYTVARYAAFSNITWDLGDDLDSFHDDRWTRDTGNLIKELDPYKHLATSHPVNNVHQDRTAEWFDFTSFQEWSRNQHTFMLNERQKQKELGRIIPQTNEEYGYEDHYPAWQKGGIGSDSADTLRRTAWDIVMAGGYQTTGESARRGTHIWPDTGGGWMNGRGDATMTMLDGYGHMVDFFTSFKWWETEPHDELVNNGNYCLAKPGEIYALYLPQGRSVTVKLEPGRYQAVSWDPQTAERIALPPVEGPSWTSPSYPEGQDRALLLIQMSR